MGSFTAPNLWLLATCRRMWFDWRVGCSVAPTHSHFLRHEERAELNTSHPDESCWRAERQVKTFRNGTAWADVHPHLPERGSGVRQVVGWKATPYRSRGPALLRHRCEDTSARSHERKIARAQDRLAPTHCLSCRDVDSVDKKKAGSRAGFFLLSGGRYWDRTSDFHRVKVALYR